MRALPFASRLLLLALLFAGLVLSARAQGTVDQRLTSMVQANVTDPSPGITNPDSAPGIFSYALACLHLDQNVSQANDLLSTFFANNPVPDSDTIGYGGYDWHDHHRHRHDKRADGRSLLARRRGAKPFPVNPVMTLPLLQANGDADLVFRPDSSTKGLNRVILFPRKPCSENPIGSP
ncbi:MAG: hypothetical protein HC841_01550 [Verrucomicrobiae bacterium]|nr:hypothetical protein [Verrucomicrobiae bacterium]